MSSASRYYLTELRGRVCYDEFQTFMAARQPDDLEERLRAAERRSDAEKAPTTHRSQPTVLVIALSGAAFVLAIFAIGLFVAEMVVRPAALEPPRPLTYPELPNPIEIPGREWVGFDPNGPPPQVHAGDNFVTLPYRCASDDGGTGLGLLHYNFTRALFTADGHRVLDIPGGENDAPLGCQRVRSTLQFVPDQAVPGLYYLGGTATAVGEKRTATVFWRTANFEVVPDDVTPDPDASQPPD